MAPWSSTLHVLIVFAHFEQKSFNAAMLGVARQTLTALGYTLEVSDLYAEKFRPTPDPAEFENRIDPDRFELMAEQENANNLGVLPPDLKREQDRIRRADVIILQFPFWWWSAPAILKGWIDRVLSNGFAYGASNLAGKSAMLSLTAETKAERFSSDATYPILHHIEEGTLRFCGLSVLPRFVAADIQSVSNAQRAELLDGFARHLADHLPATLDAQARNDGVAS